MLDDCMVGVADCATTNKMMMVVMVLNTAAAVEALCRGAQFSM